MDQFVSYNVATININTIANETKLNALRTFCRTMDLDIVFLQEVENAQLAIPGYNVVTNVDHSRRGTAIALKEYIRFSHVEKSLDGRLIAVRVENTTLANIYAPSGTALRAERERFFQNTIAFYLRHNTDHMMLAGDFNCVLRPCDASGYNHSPALQSAVRQLQLNDVWVKLYPTTPSPTYITHNSVSRLDRMYVSNGLCAHLRNAATHVCSFTNHKALTVRICLPSLGREPGRGYWSLRPHLLTDETIAEFQIRWQYVTRQRPNFPNWMAWWTSYAKPKIVSFFRWKSREAYNVFHAEHQRLYAQLQQAYDGYYQNPAMIAEINRVKAQMLMHQRNFSQNFMRINDTYLAGENMSTFQLGERRRKKTIITELQDENDNTLNSSEAIENHLLRYFRELYTAAEENEEARGPFQCERVIPENDECNMACMDEITTDEIFRSIRTSAKRKAAGCDGLPVEFYHRTFDVIHRELNLVLNEALTTDFPSDFADGVIVLVRKRGTANTARGYRPISLLNADFKILDRILKFRLERVMKTHRLLTAAQKCSNGGHSIFEATLALKDRIAQLIARKRKGKLISYDLDHAFDRVSHSFLFGTMRQLGINPAFVGLLARIAERSHSRLLVNGHLSPRFPIERSVRQGSPISMAIFVIYLHPFLHQLERRIGSDLVVAYADDISVIVTNTQVIDYINELFDQFERAAGARLNRLKTVAINVGFIDGAPLDVPWLQTAEKVKILGVFFTNSIRAMIKINWDALVSKFAQQLWLHSLRSLNLQQKVILLNTFITAKIWYVASILPPYCVHTAKITATMGSFLWRGLPARVPMEQMARDRPAGGMKLQLPALKCKALLINRHIQEMNSLPYYQSLLNQANPPPADLPCLKLLSQHIPLLPPSVREHPSSDQIHRLFLERTELPRMQRKYPGENWKRIWMNIATKQLSSDHRSSLYLLVNEKTEHRKLMRILQRADGENCLHCGAATETIQHKFGECPRVAQAWAFLQRKVTTILGGWRRLSFEELLRPALPNIGPRQRNKIMKLFVLYINYVNSINGRIDVSALEFFLNCEC